MAGSKIDNVYIEKDDYYILRIESKKHGVFDFLIDKEDYERCREYHWSVNKHKSPLNTKKYFYAVHSKMGMLHRFIMDAPKGKQVDHINGDTLDSRKSNMRICTVSENSMNRHFVSDNTSGKIGVCWNSKIPTPKWMAYININGKRTHLGYFTTYDEALKVRLDAEEKYYGEFRASNGA